MYRENPAIAQSDLKKRLGFAFSGSKAARLGTLIDDIVTLKEVNYFVGAATSNDVAKIIETYKKCGDIWQAAQQHDCKGVGSSRATKENVEKKLSIYIKNIDKTMITDKEEEIVLYVANTLETHSHVKDFFKKRKGLKHEFQKEIYWKYGNYDCKGLLDVVITNITDKDIEFDNGYILGANKSVIVDLKTGGVNSTLLKYQMWKLHYDFQLSYYNYGLTTLGYDLQNPIIAYCEQRVGVIPSWYQLTDKDLLNGRYGMILDTEWKTLDAEYKIENSVHNPYTRITNKVRIGWEHGFRVDKNYWLIKNKGNVN